MSAYGRGNLATLGDTGMRLPGGDHAGLHHDADMGSAHGVPFPHPHQSLPWQLLKCFDAVHNFGRLFVVSNDHGDTSAANGMRVLSTGLIVMGHTIVFQMSITGLVNWQDMLPPSGHIGNWTFQIVFASFYAVETFFTLSGFLVALAMLQRLQVGGWCRAGGWWCTAAMYAELSSLCRRVCHGAIMCTVSVLMRVFVRLPRRFDTRAASR